MVAQFWQAITMGVFCACGCDCDCDCWDLSAAMSIAWDSSASADLQPDPWPFVLSCALFDSRLLKAGQPLHPSAPPVPLHRPPPGHVPFGACSAAIYVAPGAPLDFGPGVEDFGGEARCSEDRLMPVRFSFVGRAVFLAFW